MARAIRREVLHRGTCIDTVWYDGSDSDDEVKRSLVEHDGYRDDIDVIRHYMAADLESLPTLTQSQADNLKVDTGTVRVWLSRLTFEDGATYNGAVSVEQRVDGRWVLVMEWDGDPR